MEYEALGWSQRYEQPVWHLMLDRKGTATAACGARGAMHGQVEKDPGPEVHRCKRCQDVVARRTKSAERQAKK